MKLATVIAEILVSGALVAGAAVDAGQDVRPIGDQTEASTDESVVAGSAADIQGDIESHSKGGKKHKGHKSKREDEDKITSSDIPLDTVSSAIVPPPAIETQFNATSPAISIEPLAQPTSPAVEAVPLQEKVPTTASAPEVTSSSPSVLSGTLTPLVPTSVHELSAVNSEFTGAPSFEEYTSTAYLTTIYSTKHHHWWNPFGEEIEPEATQLA